MRTTESLTLFKTKLRFIEFCVDPFLIDLNPASCSMRTNEGSTLRSYYESIFKKSGPEPRNNLALFIQKTLPAVKTITLEKWDHLKWFNVSRDRILKLTLTVLESI